MSGQTPVKNQNVLQVPSLSPINVRSSPGHEAIPSHDTEDEKRKQEMKKRFYSHKFWPLLLKRFYYLTEPELFKAMVKGKGNLRDICLWLLNTISLGERMTQYDQAMAQGGGNMRNAANGGGVSGGGMSGGNMSGGIMNGGGVNGGNMASMANGPFGANMNMANMGNMGNVNNMGNIGNVPNMGNMANMANMANMSNMVGMSNMPNMGNVPNMAGMSMAGVTPGYTNVPTQPYPPNYTGYAPYNGAPAPGQNMQGAVDGAYYPAQQYYPASQYEEEDMSPVKAGKARQKRTLTALPAFSAPDAARAPDTKIQLMKPKVSILEKYRNRAQTRIDSLYLPVTRKRRLVRADDMETTPATSQSPTPVSSGLLTQAFGYHEDDVPRLNHPAQVSDVDELDILEERIRANRKKLKSRKLSDDELEDEVFSDDMSEEDEDTFGSGLTSIDGQILDFLNKAPVEDLVEICNVPPKVAQLLISKRPFQTIYEVAEDRFDEATPEPEPKRRGGPRKKMGMRVIESTEFSLKGYKAVDLLVKKCLEYGEVISKQMERWGVHVTGEGELDMVDVEVGDESEESDLVLRKRSLPYISSKPALLAEDVELKSYQQVGINWLNLLYHHQLSCILADEMGLGKTCQVISFMAHLKATSEKKQPHLVVVPSSTLENWLREFRKFCPSLVVQAYYGSQAEREELRYELQEMHYDVLVTTYNLATGAAPDFKFLKNQHFDVVVYDEGHMLKNSSSERYNKLMRMKADFRVLLTGTPLQNNLKELVSLLAFMLPTLFVEKREDLQGLFNKKASVDATDNYNPLLSQQAIHKAKTMMTPFVLRRKKAQVLQYLPGKSHEIVRCDMTPTQRAIYDEYIGKGKATKLERERRKNLVGKEADEARKTPVASSSNVMMSLRKASMHPLLFRRIFTEPMLEDMSKKIMREPEYVNANRQYIYEDMQVMSDYELNALCEKFPTIGLYVLEKEKWLDSGKVKVLLEVLTQVIERKEKVLVFSLFTQMLDILEKVLSFSDITFLRLDGQTSVDTRQDIIDRFYEDDAIPVFLLSTKAGGFGINLVAANNVVIFDQSFNPHDDKQAEDRAHRVGQANEVKVTKLISRGTIDENILMLAENKLQLDESISNEANEGKFEEKAASMFEKLLFQ